MALSMGVLMHFGVRLGYDTATSATSWAGSAGSGALRQFLELARDGLLVAGAILTLAALLKVDRRSTAADHGAHDHDRVSDVNAHRKSSLASQKQELEAARQEALNARRAAAEFLASMSHEIRTPISAILGFAELLVDDQGRASSQQVNTEAIRTIRKQGAHLLGVINGVLDLAKIESGKMQIESTRCSPTQLVNEVHALFGARAAVMGLTLSVEHQFPLPDVVLSDPLRIRQVLVNLVGNSLKFTPPPPLSPGRIVLRVSAIRSSDGTSTLVFECSDTGRGISDDLAPKLFEPFTQSAASTAREFGGSGLGLSICHRFAKLLGGTIAFRRHETEPGTTFVLTLPIREAPDTIWLHTLPDVVGPSLDTEASIAPGEPPTLRGRVLLVDDSPDIQRLISHLLTRAGAAVDLAANGRIALEMARSADGQPRYDLVLMDMQMPELDGYGAATELRAAGFRQPIIALTANALDGDRQRCLDAGCNDYLSKPVDRRTLIETCAKWMPQPRSIFAGSPPSTQLAA